MNTEIKDRGRFEPGAATGAAQTPPAGAAAGQAEEGLDLRALFRTFWRNRNLIGLITAAAIVLGLYMALSATPLYTATASVMLDTSEEQIIDLNSVVSGLSSDYETINTQIEVMTSRNLLEKVVRKLDLTADPEFNPDLMEAMAEAEPPGPVERVTAPVTEAIARGRRWFFDIFRGARVDLPRTELQETEFGGEEFQRLRTAIDILRGAVRVRSVELSYVFEISVTTTDPVKSARIANAVAESYILDQLEVKFEATRQATSWLSERVADLKVELEAAEQAVKDYSASTSLLSNEALAAKERQIKEQRERLAGLRERRDELVARRDRLAALREAGDLEALAEAIGDARMVRLARDLSEADGDDDGSLSAARTRFESLRRAAALRLENEIERISSQYDLIAESTAALEEQVRRESADLVQLLQLRREAEASRLIYEYFLSRLKETSLQQGIHQADARVLSPAIPPVLPSAPRKSMIVGMMAMAGLFLGTLGVMTIALTRTSVRSPEEIEAATGLQVIGIIPAAPTRRRRNLLDYVIRKPTSVLAESVRNLRTVILMSSLDREPKVIMVTSSVPKEGKTTTALLLAQNSAMLGKKVLLIECDLRRRTFTAYFDAPGGAGLFSILSGASSVEEVIHRDQNTGLDVILGDESKANAADVFSSARFAEFLAEMRGRYDHIVIDTPPVLAVPDARVISRHADAIIYALRWNATTREMIRAGLELFHQVGARITGLVITQADAKRMSRYGYQGYGYGYQQMRYYTN